MDLTSGVVTGTKVRWRATRGGDLGKNLKWLDMRLIPEGGGLLLRLTRCQIIPTQQQTEKKITSVNVIEHNGLKYLFIS